MKKILVFSYQRTAIYRYADINFYNEIKKKIPADFAAASYKMQNFQPFETYPKIFKKNTKFKKLKRYGLIVFFKLQKFF